MKAPPSPPPPKSGRKACSGAGVRFLLCSAAGAAAAATITTGRWVLAEAGEVLLLFADAAPAAEGACQMEGIDVDFYQCADGGQNALADAGQVLVAMASSPQFRAAPLILVILSTTAFVVGVILTQRDLKEFFSWMQCVKKYGDECLALAGAADAGELVEKLEETGTRGRNSLQRQAAKAVECMDTMTIDDVLRSWIKAGVELSLGAVGGVVLYSIPEEAFAKSSSNAKDARRRLIRAADPSLEQILFRPGGAWEVLPKYLRRSFTGGHEVGSGSCVKLLADDDEDTGSTDNDESSSDTPLASPVSSASGSGSRHELGQCPNVVHAEVKGDIPIQSNGEGESIGEALAATVTDLVVSNVYGRNRLERKGQQQEERHEEQKDPLPPSPSLLQLETILRHTTIAASFLFLCHLRRSPSTRKVWGSAIKLLASLGLASTAIGAGVTSAVLNSNQPLVSALAKNPIVNLLCSSFAGVVGSSQLVGLPRDISTRIQWVLDRVRAEIRKNKRLQMVLAFTVLYGIKRSASSRRGRRFQMRS